MRVIKAALVALVLSVGFAAPVGAGPFDEGYDAYHRGFYETVDHHHSTGMPPLPYTSRPWKFSETPASTRTAAPTLGQHNHFVLSDMLGLPDSQVDDMEVEGVIGDEPVSQRKPPMVSLDDQKRQGRILMYDDDFKEQLDGLSDQ